MKAVLTRAGALVCDDVPEPIPAAGQALVKTLACGICGSDLHLFHQTARNPAAPSIIMGHEYCAEILDSRRFKPGARVVAQPYIRGATRTETIGFSPNFAGGFSERMLLAEDLLLEVPNGLPAEIAALTEPMAVGAHGVNCARMDGDTVALVIGLGPVGAAVVANLKARGFGPIIAADFSPERRAQAEALGADLIIDPARETPYGRWQEFGVEVAHEPLRELLGVPAGKRAVIFECVGAPGVLQAVIDGAPFGADIVLLGACLEPDTITPAHALGKHLTIRTVLGYSGEEFARALRDLAEGVLDGGRFVTDRVGLSGVADAFERLADPGDQMKIIVEPQRL